MKGFSLLEILVALLILVIGLASVLGLYGAGTYSHRRAVNDAILTRMASQIFTDLESGQHPCSKTLENVADQTYAGFPGIYTYDLSFELRSGMEEKSRLVTLIIKWPKGGSVASEQFQIVLFFPDIP
jgi:prepilin-type N-terminal cleavage/methylation domain-containing protein